jgi:hypothetical protein
MDVLLMLHREIMNLSYAVNDGKVIASEDYAREFAEAFKNKMDKKEVPEMINDLLTICNYALEKGYTTTNWWYENEYTQILYLGYMKYCGVIE